MKRRRVDEDELRAFLQQRAEGAVVHPSPGPLIAERARRRRSRRRRTVIAATAAAVLVVLGGVILATRSTPKDADLTTDVVSPGEPSTTPAPTTTLDPVVSLAQQNSPKPSYPEPTRSQVVAAFTAYSDCMRRNGVPDYPQLPANFGDGTVTQPVLNDGPTDQAAQAACRTERDALSSVMLAANGR